MSEPMRCYQCCSVDLCKHIDRGTRTLASPACDDFDPGLRWIPVTELLPEPKVKVAIFTRSRAIYLGWYANHGGIKGFETAVGFLQLGRITHWMPLPEPPKEDRDA